MESAILDSKSKMEISVVEFMKFRVKMIFQVNLVEV